MENNQPVARRGRTSKTAVGVGLIAAGALAGGVLAGTLSASADTTPAPSSTSSSSTADPESGASTGTAQQGTGTKAGHANGGGRSDETVLTGADAETVKAAALKAVPGGTIVRVETDAGDGEYEAHMTKADGTKVTVKFDKNFAVIGVEDGMGKGDPAPASGTGAAGGQSGATPSATSSSAT